MGKIPSVERAALGEKPRMKKGLELTGHRYGRLQVLKRSKTPQFWVCQCDCGKSREVKQAYLRFGVTRSCGCLMKDVKAPPPYRPWTDAELERLRSADTTGVLSLELRRAKGDIVKKRRESGIVRDNRRRSGIRPPAMHTHL